VPAFDKTAERHSTSVFSILGKMLPKKEKTFVALAHSQVT
jgi:hypothetical protein